MPEYHNLRVPIHKIRYKNLDDETSKLIYQYWTQKKVVKIINGSNNIIWKINFGTKKERVIAEAWKIRKKCDLWNFKFRKT